MVAEEHLDHGFIKKYTNDDNEHLLVILPGQTLSPRVFWDFKLPDGKTHSEHFYDAGIDVILFDPVGYGNSKQFYEYDRIGYARQIHNVTSKLTKPYKTKTVLGFSTSTAPAIIASQTYFNKVIIHSPAFRSNRKYFVKHEEVYETNIDKLKSERIGKISDKIIPKPNRIEGWEERILEVIGKREWSVPGKVVRDISNYWVLRGNHGFNPAKVPPILSIIGEYDYEMTTGGYTEFRSAFPNLQEVIIPESTHFSMWENQSHRTRAEVIQWVLQ
jgi:pimeloyl-ACP methyl ester carboxylesterase